MKCPRCSNEISGNQTVCNNCGYDLKFPSGQSSLTPVPAPEAGNQVLERKRKIWIACVLILNSLIGLAVFAYYGKDDPSGIESRSVVPWIIDIILAIQLFRQKEVLQWIVVRAALGTLIWGGLLAYQQDWFGVVAQVLFGTYFIYYAKVKVSQKSFRIANFGILPLFVIILILSTFLSYQTNSAFINNVKQGFADFDVYNKQQQELFATDTSRMTNEEIHKVFSQLLDVSLSKGEKLNSLRIQIDKALEDYKSAEDQKIFKAMKDLLMAQQNQNNKVIEFAKFALTIDFDNATDQQLNTFDALYEEVLELEKEIEIKASELDRISK